MTKRIAHSANTVDGGVFTRDALRTGSRVLLQ